ncbi:MAG: hypothetical protein MJZ21_06115, partial [archaeon]|nr:hypothetical protein [archaeon]
MSGQTGFHFSQNLFIKVALGSISFMLLYVNSLVDQYFISLGGAEEAAGYTLVAPAFNMMMAVCATAGSITVLTIRKSYEEKRMDEVNRYSTTALVYASIIGAIFTVVLSALVFGFYKLTIKSEIMTQSSYYLEPMILFFIVFAFYGVLTALLMLDGGSKRCFESIVVILVFNTLFNELLHEYYDLDLWGIGMSTSLAFTIAVLLQLEWFLSKRGSIRLSPKFVDFKISGFRFSEKLLRKFFARGFVKNACELIMRIGVYSHHALSYSLPYICSTLGYMFSMGATPELSKEYMKLYKDRDMDGAKNLFKVSNFTLFIAILIASMVVYIFAYDIVNIFTTHPSISEKKSIIAETLRIFAISTPFVGLKYAS